LETDKECVSENPRWPTPGVAQLVGKSLSAAACNGHTFWNDTSGNSGSPEVIAIWRQWNMGTLQNMCRLPANLDFAEIANKYAKKCT